MKFPLAMVLAGCIALTGCASSSIQEPAMPESTVLEFWTVSERYAQYFGGMAEQFSLETDQRIEINAKIYSRDQLANKLLATIHSSTGIPDMLDIHHRELEPFVQGGNLMLYPLAANSEWAEWNAESGALAPFVRGDFCYAVPYARERLVLFCNPGIFTRCHIDPNALKTWEDMREAGQAIRQQMNIPILCLDAENGTLYKALMLQQNSHSADWSLEKILVSAEHQLTANLLEAMVLEDRSVAVAPGYNIYNNQFYAAMESAEVAAVAAELQYAAMFLDYMPALHDSVTAYPLPVWDDASPSVHLPQYGTAITLQCSDITLTREFLLYAKTGTAAYTQLTEELYVDNLSPDSATASIYPRDGGYASYFRGSPLKLQDSRNRVWMGSSTGLHQAAEQFTLELLAKMDTVV